MELEDYRWLVSPSALRWLERAEVDDRPTVQIAAALRKDLSADRTHLILEQIELRKRARVKFPQAARMFFTRKGLEQSTDLWVARRKAMRFAKDSPVADLCCGIGGDMLGLAERGAVLAVDNDPIVALLAEANAHALDCGSARVVAADVTTAALENCESWHLDPDRRPEGRRVSRLDASTPSRDWFHTLRQRIASGALKLAPSDVLGPVQTDQVEWEFISRDGEVRQQVVYFGLLVKEPLRCTCTVLARQGNVAGEFASRVSFDREGMVDGQQSADASPVTSLEIGKFVYEPDPAILVAGLESQLAHKHRLAFTSPTRGYLTGDAEIDDPVLSGFRVLESLQFDRKRVKALLRDRRIGTLEVKSRDGVSNANQLQQEFSTDGDRPATLLLTRFRKKTWAILAERLRQRQTSADV